MVEDHKEDSGNQATMRGVLRDKPQHASSFADNQYAGDSEPLPEEREGTAGGANVSKQGGGTSSSKQAGNTGHTPDASG